MQKEELYCPQSSVNSSAKHTILHEAYRAWRDLPCYFRREDREDYGRSADRVEQFNAMCEKILALPANLSMAVQYTFNATAVEVTPNAQGRVIIPQSLREFAEIEGDAVVIGMTNRLEIWSKKNYEDYVASQNENLALALKELKL